MSTDEELIPNVQKNIRKIDSCLTELRDQPSADNLRELFNLKYKNFNKIGEIYLKKIRIIEIKDNDSKKYFKNLLETSKQYRYHPDEHDDYLRRRSEYLAPEPLWVSRLPFPNHGGDEESYYLGHGLDSYIDICSSERAYSIKTRNIVLIIDNQDYPITIGRTAHA